MVGSANKSTNKLVLNMYHCVDRKLVCGLSHDSLRAMNRLNNTDFAIFVSLM